MEKRLVAKAQRVDNDSYATGYYYVANGESWIITLHTARQHKVKPETLKVGDVSDGFNTFNELYHHRAILFSVICHCFPERAWKSKLHSDGTMYDGMFIVGFDSDLGQATYHCDIDPYWEQFYVNELEHAPAFDGHTSAQTLRRLYYFGIDSNI